MPNLPVLGMRLRDWTRAEAARLPRSAPLDQGLTTSVRSVRRITGVVVRISFLVVVASVSVALKAPASRSAVEAEVTSTLDRTYSCLAKSRAGVPLVIISAYVSSARGPGYFGMYTTADTSPGDNDVTYLEFTADRRGFRVDPSGCRRSTRVVPLSARGIPSNGVLTSDFVGGFDADCKATTGRVDVRVRLTLSDGKPSKALVAVRNQGLRRTPLAFISWTGKREATFLSARCAS